MAAWKERERQTDPPVGGSGEEGANLPGKSAGKGLGRKEWRAQGGWGVGAELGGEQAECARGSSLATPTPRPGATCAPPYRPHPSWGTKKPAVRVSCAPRGSSRVLPLPGRLSWIRKCGLSESPLTERVCGANSRVGSWSVLRQDDQPGGHTEPGN